MNIYPVPDSVSDEDIAECRRGAARFRAWRDAVTDEDRVFLRSEGIFPESHDLLKFPLSKGMRLEMGGVPYVYLGDGDVIALGMARQLVLTD